MATYEYYRFGLYYLGYGSNIPSFQNATFLRNVTFRVKKSDYDASAWKILGTVSSDGSIQLNANGLAFNSTFGLDNQIIDYTYPRWGGYANARTAFDYYSDGIADIASLVSYGYLQQTPHWFAIANSRAYAAFGFQDVANAVGGTGDLRGPGLVTRISNVNVPIKLINDDSNVDDTYTANVLPIIGSVNSKAGFFYTLSRNLFYSLSDETYKNFAVCAIYTANDKNFHSYASTTLSQNEVAFLKDSEFTPAPYPEDDISVVDIGGGGTFDDSSDDILIPSTPSLTVADSGFVRIYNPTLSQLKSLAQYMWTDQNFLTTLMNHAKQLLENPIESIVSLNLLPCQIPNSDDEVVKVLFISTGISMPPATTQFVEVDCGSVDIKEYYGSALDYSPYTKIHCYLPYIGQVTLDTDEIMNSTVSIRYRIDIVTGMCVALISVNGSVLYQFSGHCAISMPLTSADFSTYVSAAIGTAKAVAGIAAAGAGATGAASQLLGTAAPRTTVTSFDTTDTVRNPATGRQVKAGTHHEDKSVTSKGSSFGEMATAAAVNTVSSVMGSKTVVEHSGGFTGNSGYLAVRRPYLIIEIPRMCYPENYGSYNGYPSMITVKLSECKGYTKIQNIRLTGFSATNEEMSEIAEMLMGGVIF